MLPLRKLDKTQAVDGAHIATDLCSMDAPGCTQRTYQNPLGAKAKKTLYKKENSATAATASVNVRGPTRLLRRLRAADCSMVCGK